MAEVARTRLIDDLDGGAADEVITFQLDGECYEIDLSEENARKFRQVFSRYIAVGRRQHRGGESAQDREGDEPAIGDDAPAFVAAPSAGGPSQAALARNVADRILHDIAKAGWKSGHQLGSEAELRERHGVSRAVLRESLSLLEHQGLAHMRRGPAGGLTVLPPSAASAIDAVLIHLYFIGTGIQEVLAARETLASTAVELAVARASDGEIAELISEAAVDGSLVTERLAEIGRNRALAFLLTVLDRIKFTSATQPVPGDSAGKARRSSALTLVRAVAARDVERAKTEACAVIRQSYESNGYPSDCRIDLTASRPARAVRLAESTAMNVVVEIAESGWRVTRYLGSEAELMGKYAVSRAVWREALRILEYHQVVSVRRGSSGGVFIAKPGSRPTTEALAIYLTRVGVSPDEIVELRVSIELANLAAASANALRAPATMAGLHEALAVERDSPGDQGCIVEHGLHAVLAQLSGNRALELFAGVLVRLTRLRSTAIQQQLYPVMRSSVIGEHEAIVRLVHAQDFERAQEAMRDHLAGMDTLLD